MSRAKLYLVLAVAMVCTLAFAAPAFAWTHGQFDATTDACAGCHVAHAAEAPKLLKTGPTQTHFCFLCHGDGGASAPYDVKIGKTQVGSTVYASTAGGFCEQQGTALTSRHNVWGLVGETGSVIDETYKQFFVPGSTQQFTGSGFVCGSCHDPHAGGGVPDADGYIDGRVGINPRLLRKSITVGSVTYSGLNVAFGFETVGTFTYGNPSVDSGVYRVIEYVYGSTPWCGACHFKFKAPEGSGGTPGPKYYDMYRHAFDLDLYDVVRPGTYNYPDTSFNKTPLETSKTTDPEDDVLACLTCHRAHSTTVEAAGWASEWPRSEGGTSTTSALLRMDNRGVCFNCHDAGKYNLP
ncbi:MAG TPA: hypothetical protein EYP63_03100 [Desulfotomaculum sp.]|nr:hypothetical protein [Desulfotomaculum sp.]